MAIKKTGATTGGNVRTYMATGATVTELALLNSNYKNAGVGSSCMMKETREVAFFDGTEWFIW